jgi:hypothetical protein
VLKHFLKFLFAVSFFFLVSCTSVEIGVDIVTPQIFTEVLEAPIESVQNGTQEISTPQPTSTIDITGLTQTPKVTPFVKTTISTPIAVNTTVASPNEQKFSLPNIVLNLAPSPNPLATCADTKNLGQLLFSQFPYDKIEFLLSESTIAYYQPVWAPSGDNLAFVSTNLEDFTESFQENGSWRFYEDSVSVMGDDGAKQEISISFSRAEFLSTENNSCTVTDGITSIVGWSFDSNWVAFIYQTLDSDGNNFSLYISNLDSRETMLVAEKVLHALWRPNQNTIVATTYGENPAIELISIGDFSTGIQKSTIPLSSKFPTQLGLGQIIWSANNKGLFVIISDVSFFNAPTALWSYDFDTNEWDSVLDLTEQSGFQLGNIGENILLCAREDGQNTIQIFDQVTLQLLGVIDEVDGMGCEIDYLSDMNGQELVSFNNIVDRDSVWISSILEQDSLLEKVIDGNFEQLGVYNIVSYSWRIIPSD